jgi:anthranilate phosphoribosyltransferase
MAMKRLVKELVSTPESFSVDDCSDALELIMKGDATPAQIGAFLVGMNHSGYSASPPYISACVDVIRKHSQPIPGILELKEEGTLFVDIVGTGGDGFDTFNVSTTAAFVVGGCQNGLLVAKVSSGFLFVIRDRCSTIPMLTSSASMVIALPLHSLAQQTC